MAEEIRNGAIWRRGLYYGKIEGDGMAFCHAGGHIIKKDLKTRDLLQIDTGCIVAYTQDIQSEIQSIRGIRNKVFGGEGFFFATLRGPGTVWLQSLPISKLASRISQYSYGNKEAGNSLNVTDFL